MCAFRDHKPTMAMLGLQFTYAGVALLTRAALLQGMSPRVSVVYRQAVATLIIAPIACFSRTKSSIPPLGLKSFSMIFLTAFIGVTVNQNMFYEGLYLASSTMGSAMGNLIPAITFVMATIVGLEKINITSFRSIAKILGTVLCVGGAICMTLLKGPKLLMNTDFLQTKSLFVSEVDDWLLGCLLLLGSSCCWSLWLILQVPVSACYPDHLSLTVWMGLFSTIQSAMVALFLEPDPEAWLLHTNLELVACFFAGIGSGVSFFVQAWCVSRKGPLFSAMFNPLCTVITTVLAAPFLHEQIYTGSLIGAGGVMFGLYVVLWGKAGDEQVISIKEETDPNSGHIDQITIEEISIASGGGKARWRIDLEEPLLSDNSREDHHHQIAETIITY